MPAGLLNLNVAYWVQKNPMWLDVAFIVQKKLSKAIRKGFCHLGSTDGHSGHLGNISFGEHSLGERFIWGTNAPLCSPNDQGRRRLSPNDKSPPVPLMGEFPKRQRPPCVPQMTKRSFCSPYDEGENGCFCSPNDKSILLILV